MALTRAQLLMGNSAQGSILSGQPQGVRPGGAGIAIGTDGIISVDSQSIVGVMKLGQTVASAGAAFNGYTWPSNAGSAGQQLTTNGAGILGWGDSDGIPWTQKGQLIVGTGVSTDTLLNVGGNTSFLLADSSTASGLIYSGSSTSAAQMPSGNTGARPAPGVVGQTRFNTDTGKLEVYGNGAAWESVASASSGSFVAQTSITGAAVIPGGNDAGRPAAATGLFRYNGQAGIPVKLEYYDGVAWTNLQTGVDAPYTGTLPIVVTGSVISINPATNTTAGSMSAADKAKLDSAATIVSSVTGTLPITVANGTTTPVIAINAATTALTGSVQLADGPTSQAGSSATLVSTPAFTVPKDAAGMTGAAIIPGGSTGQQPTTPVTGMLRYNSTTLPAFMEFWDSAAWTPVGAPPVAGLGIRITGDIVKVNIPQQTNPPASGTAAPQAQDGSMYWDDTLGALFILYNNGGSSTWVQTTSSGGGGGLGVGQTWQNVSGSRTIGTTYTNSTGQPIMLAFECPANNTSALNCFMFIDGLQIGQIQGFAGGIGMSMNFQLTGVVPPGSTYSATGAVGAWYELR